MSVNVSGGDLQWDANINMSGFESQLTRIRAGLDSLSDNQKKNTDSIADFAKKAATAATAYFSIQAATNFVQSMVQVRGEFQQIEVAYRTMLGSKEKADKLMAESVKLAAITPFTLQDVARGSKQLLAYGFAAKDITTNLEMLGNVASGVGSQLGDLTYLYGTLKASGRVTQIDINQFAGRGIPIYQALADTMKITTAQVREYVSAGKIGFPEIEKAFNNLTGAGGQFYNLMQEQSKTLTGQLSNLEDAWSRMLNDLGTKNEGIFASAIGGAITLVDNYQKIIDIIGALVVGYGAYRAALLISAATTSIATYATTGFTAAEIIQYYWTATLTKAQKLLNITMLANPYVAVAAALAALGTYLYLASENTIKLKTASELTAEAVSKQGDAVETAEAKLKVYVEMLKNNNLSEAERLNIYNKIKSIDPSIVKGIDAKTISYVNLKSSVDAYIVSLRQKFAAEANEGAIKASIENENAIRKQLEGVGHEGFSTNFGFIIGEKGLEDEINLKRTNALKATLLKQQIETNKLIGKSIQTGSKDQIQAAENDLKQIEQEKKRYAKGTIELATLQQQAIEKQDEINSLRALKKKNDNPNEAVKVVRNISVIDKEIESLKDDQKTVESKTKYASIQLEINKLEKEKLAITGESAKVSAKNAKTEEDFAKKKLDILNEINQAQSDFNAKNESSNAKEIEDNKKKYAELRKKATDYNKEAIKAGKETIGGKDLAMINNIEAKENYEIIYKQKTSYVLQEIENQKKLYEDYEQYKLDFGEKKAKEKFSKDIDLNKTYQQFIEDQLGKSLIKDPSQMTGSEKAKLEAIKKLNDEAIKDEEYKNETLLKDFKTYSEKRKTIQERYLSIANDLRKNGNNEQAQIAINQGVEEVNALDNQQIHKMDSYKNLFEFLGRRSKQHTLQAIAEFERELQAFKGSSEEKKKAQIEVDKLKKSINSNSTEGLQDIISQLSQISNEFSNINSSVSNIANVLLSSAKAYLDIQKGVKDVQNPDKSTTEKIGAGIGVVGAAISVANTVFGYFKGLKAAKEEATKAMNDYQSSAIKGELDYQSLLRRREADEVKRGKNSYRSIVDQLELLKKQSPEIQKTYDAIFNKLQGQQFVDAIGYQHGTWIRKAKTWDIMASLAGSNYNDLEKLYTQGKLKDTAKSDFEALKALKEELESAGISVKDLQDQLNELLTGTSVSGLSDSLTDLFQNGKLSAADFAENFESIMQKAISNSFKYKYLEDAMKPFYDALGNLMSSGTPTQDQINTLKKQYTSIGEQAADYWKQIENITGISGTLNSSSGTSVSGAIQRNVTESTANEWIGLIRAQYDIAKRTATGIEGVNLNLIKQFQLSVQNLDSVIKIEANTFRTANNTDLLNDKLSQIIANTKTSSSTPYDKGILG